MAVAVCCLMLAGCAEQQMARQPAYRPLQPSAFFADGRASRPFVPGTVARGQLEEDVAFFTGKTGKRDERAQAAAVIAAATAPFAAVGAALESDPYVEEFPVALTEEFLARGRQRFDVFCAVCHDRAGTGEGIVKRRGFTPPPSLHLPRLRAARPGYFFHVITRGYGAMPDYASQIPPGDRWAIVGYVRALQLSQHATLADVPEPERAALKNKGGKSK